MQITFDGTCGSGKSTIAKAVASRLGFYYFNVGSVYRALTTFFLEQNLNPHDASAFSTIVENLHLSVVFENGVQKTIINDLVYDKNLTSLEISEKVPLYSSFPPLRDVVKKCQREFAWLHDSVMEGRDVGSEVLPNADLKFFVNADIAVRFNRRFSQFVANGENPDKDRVLDDIYTRDMIDLLRKTSPLAINPDFIYLDTTNTSVAESVDKVVYEFKKMQGEI